MLSDELGKISWEETTKIIYPEADADVCRASSKEHCDVNDFTTSISPATASYLETMACLSRKYALERFGKTILVFVSLYITNSCIDSCVYCGLNHNNPMKRIILTEEEMVNEYKAIKKLASFEDLLLVTGENLVKAGVDYIERALLPAKPYFSNLQIEVIPLRTKEYERFMHAGLNGVICFQETYNRTNYNVYHPRGTKPRSEWCVNSLDRMGQAGVHKIGMGVLIDLGEWRTDITMMAYHLRYPQEHYWEMKYSVNFPRMRPSENGGFQPNVVTNDRELAQMTFAMCILDHDVGISYSIREGAEFRNHMATLGVTTMNAEGKTEPGGCFTYPQALEQLHVSDKRKAVEVDTTLRSLGRVPVYKDWDTVLTLTQC